MNLVGVLDCNNFFVSCERLFRPDLMKKPVVVLSSNDGCVVARSQEVKDIGIPMGVPYFQVKDILKKEKVTIFSAHIALYRDISSRVFDVCEREMGVIQKYSIDECFFSIPDEGAEIFLSQLKKTIEREVGIPVTIGVASSKTQAKYVNSVAKKTSGLEVWSSERWQKEAYSAKLATLWGVGVNRSRKFSSHSLVTVEDLCALPNSTVRRLFGLEGARLKSELLGEAVFMVDTKTSLNKSIMSTRSFADTTTDLRVLEDAVAHHVYQGVRDLEEMDLLANTMRIMIYPSRYGDFLLEGKSLEARFTIPTKDLFVIRHEAEKLLHQCYKKEVPYKKAGVILGGLVATKALSLSLFGEASDSREDSTALLSKTIFDINKRFGKLSIQLGRVSGQKNKWKSSKKSQSPAYTTRWSQLQTVYT